MLIAKYLLNTYCVPDPEPERLRSLTLLSPQHALQNPSFRRKGLSGFTLGLHCSPAKVRQAPLDRLRCGAG